MHDYLRAVGFGSIENKTELEKVLKLVENEPKKDFITDDGIKPVIGEKSKDFAHRMGITVRGEYDESGDFCRDYYFPHFEGKNITFHETVSMEKHMDRISYIGISDNPNIGVSMMFHLQNIVDYVEFRHSVKKDEAIRPMILAGLSLSGKILLPIKKSQKDILKGKEEAMIRGRKIKAARDGDPEAIESLTLEDLDLFTMAAKRARREDVFSIVETYFMPYGIACDQYSILGYILDVEKVMNNYTNEEIYVLRLECNSLNFDVCINAKDLLGEPQVGRRFKGNIWMQGSVDFRAEL